jgi:hypothetical protein
VAIESSPPISERISSARLGIPRCKVIPSLRAFKCLLGELDPQGSEMRRFNRYVAVAAVAAAPILSVIPMPTPALAATCNATGGQNAGSSAAYWRTYALLETSAAANCQVSTALKVGTAQGVQWLNSNLWKPKNTLSDKTFYIGGNSPAGNGWYTRQV